MSEVESTKLVEYTPDNANIFPEEFRREIDDVLIRNTGADAGILWALGGKIFLEQAVESEEYASLRLAKFEVDPGYNAEHHLYVLGGKVFVEDDYDWNEIPDRLQLEHSPDYVRSVYVDPDTGEQYDCDDSHGAESDDCDDDECEDTDVESVSDTMPYPTAGKVSALYGRNDIFAVNYLEEVFKDSQIKYEPLVVNKFNLDNPILKVEKAYRDAFCEIESYPTCGWIVLMHDGHFYVPVESVEDPVNHDVFYYIKIFNSYPVAATSGRISMQAGVEIFDKAYTIGIRYRPGYCVNWRKLFFEHLLPKNYLELIPDLYSVTDKPYGMTNEKTADYDGFERNFYEDDIDDDAGDDIDDDGVKV